MKNTFRASWKSQIFYYFGAYCVFRSLQVVTGFGIAQSAVPSEKGFIVALLLLATGAASILIGVFQHKRDLAAGDSDRTLLAEEALKEAIRLAGTGRRLLNTIYLRPFRSTNAFVYENPGIKAIGTPSFYERETELDLERVIAEAVEETAPLIALGQPGEHYGAGRIITDDKEWQDILKSLAQSARYIVLLPSYHEGTLWEIGWLKDTGNLHRTVFVMPPAPKRGAIEIKEHWTKTANALLARHGIDLPPYRQNGALFRCEASGTSAGIEEFPKYGGKAIIGYLRRRIDSLEHGDNETIQTYAQVSVPGKKSRRVSYYAVAGAFTGLAFLIVLLEGTVAMQKPSFGQKFVKTLEQTLRETLPEGKQLPTNHRAEVEDDTTQRTRGDFKTISPVGRAASASISIPRAWSAANMSQNAILLRPGDERIACLAASKVVDGDPTHAVVFAKIEEKQILHAALQTAIATLEKTGVSQSKLRQIKSSGGIDIEVVEEHFDSPVLGYVARGESRLEGKTTVSRVIVKVNSEWIVKIDCGGPSKAMEAEEAVISKIFAGLSLEPGVKKFKPQPGTLNDETIDNFVEAVFVYMSEKDYDRALKAALIGNSYILTTAKKNEDGQPSLGGVQGLKSALLNLYAGNIYFERGETKNAEERLGNAVGIYDALKVEDDEEIAEARARLAQLRATKGKK